MFRVIICGGRNFADKARAFSWLDKINARYAISEVIEGGAAGADRIGRMWAKERGVRCTTVNAEWDKYGKRAGYLRNKRMRDEFAPDAVIALPGGVGTQMMIGLAREAGLKVFTATHTGDDARHD